MDSPKAIKRFMKVIYSESRVKLSDLSLSKEYLC